MLKMKMKIKHHNKLKTAIKAEQKKTIQYHVTPQSKTDCIETQPLCRSLLTMKYFLFLILKVPSGMCVSTIRHPHMALNIIKESEECSHTENTWNLHG